MNDKDPDLYDAIMLLCGKFIAQGEQIDELSDRVVAVESDVKALLTLPIPGEE
jgi:hypothetical protein